MTATIQLTPFRGLSRGVYSNMPPTTQISKKRILCSTQNQEPRKVRRIASSPFASEKAPDTPIGQSSEPMEPQKMILSSLASQGHIVSSQMSLDLKNFFIERTEEQMETYAQAAEAVRSKNFDALRKMHEEGLSLQCSNRFGESLIHMACRRGLTDVVAFLISDAGVSIRVRDDYGRTPLHDACWTCEPNLELMDLLIKECPDLLLIEDKRGHNPFDYVRKEHWGIWNRFLEQRMDLLCPKHLPTSKQ
uniref:Uncharacterized protein n=1 Tax=Helicotheca tamesis TaxID=374047 RepID=A0A7S2IC66_9STRA|mmetsp:Transcript_7678/g.10465  ORF Transcript_7678/g.10465 Transcript_7678/m.10465 type:complete len:248 (+) Transcript_7678:166-909(+)